MPCRTKHEQRIFNEVYKSAFEKYGSARAFMIGNAALRKYRER